MVATDAYYETAGRTYLPCGCCDGEGCCVCDHYGYIHKDHPLFGAVLIDDPDTTEQGAVRK